MTGFDEKYRRKTPGAEPAAPVAAPPTESPGKESYQAFNAVTQPQFELWVRTNSANSDTDTAMPYSRRNHMITDGSGFVISQHYDTPIISVTVQGRNLQEIFRRLLRHEVEWLMEFDPRKWAAPPEDAPCITGIEIKRKPLPEPRNDDAARGEKTPPAKPRNPLKAGCVMDGKAFPSLWRGTRHQARCRDTRGRASSPRAAWSRSPQMGLERYRPAWKMSQLAA
jgi:hypothetical protein